MWICWCLLFSKRQPGKFPGKVHIPETVLESTLQCNPSLPLGLESVPAQCQLSKAASTGSRHHGCTRGKRRSPALSLAIKIMEGTSKILPSPCPKALSSPKALASEANRVDLEIALTFWHEVTPKRAAMKGEWGVLELSLPSASKCPKAVLPIAC